MKYYCVTSSFDDHGRVKASITDTVEAEERPQNTTKSTVGKDIYNDWFDTRKQAQAFLKEVKNC